MGIHLQIVSDCFWGPMAEAYLLSGPLRKVFADLQFNVVILYNYGTTPRSGSLKQQTFIF